MRHILFTCMILSVLASSGCNKDDGNNDDTNSLRAALINHKWQIKSNISIDSMNRETDLLSGQEEYKKDDYLIFNEDSTYEVNDNIILQTDTASRIIDSGTWLISADNRLVRHSDMYEHDYEPATIKTLTSSSFVTETYFPSDRSTIRTSYIKVP
ncbi:MAG TPA: hypothetical protein VLC28_04660 [Flavitalea sp.]|nr:hypothetical protein [Flavitalea sp.]